MLSIPLVWRELLVQSRNRATYDARMGWGLLMVGILGIMGWNFPQQSANGYYVLSGVHACFAVMLAVMAPVGAADSISRERREGTLGLLLLTELTPTQIVLGKLAAHLLRLVYFSLMMVPFLILPVLMGGVGFQDFVLSGTVLFAITAAGLAGGIVASALFVGSGLALSFGVLAGIGGALFLGFAVANTVYLSFDPRASGPIPFLARVFYFGGGFLLFPLQARDIATRFATSRWLFSYAEVGLFVLSLMTIRFGFLFATRRIKQQGALSVESKREATFRKRFLTPILWRTAFRRSLRRKLDRNPLTWLEYRTAWARTARWAMILMVLGMECLLWVDLPSRPVVEDRHFAMLLGLVLFLTLKSAHSFQAEKESGAFELLLVTPTTEKKLLYGRLKALAGYYLPAVLLLLLPYALATLAARDDFYTEPNLTNAVRKASLAFSLFSVPCCGLFFALRSRSFFPALLWTAGLVLFAPSCVWAAFSGLLWMASRTAQWRPAMVLDDALREVWWPVLLAVVLYHFLAVVLSTRATLELLKNRSFGERN